MKPKKTTIVLQFAELKDSSLCGELEAEFSSRELFREKNLTYCGLKKEVDEFNVPVGNDCFLVFDSADQSLAFSVSSRKLFINLDFSEIHEYVYLEFKNFCGYDAKKIVDYFEREWRLSLIR